MNEKKKVWVTVTRTLSIPVSVSCHEDQVQILKNMDPADFYFLYAPNIETIPRNRNCASFGVLEIGEAQMQKAREVLKEMEIEDI
jgi:hypothetical protein